MPTAGGADLGQWSSVYHPPFTWHQRDTIALWPWTQHPDAYRFLRREHRTEQPTVLAYVSAPPLASAANQTDKATLTRSHSQSQSFGNGFYANSALMIGSAVVDIWVTGSKWRGLAGVQAAVSNTWSHGTAASVSVGLNTDGLRDKIGRSSFTEKDDFSVGVILESTFDTEGFAIKATGAAGWSHSDSFTDVNTLTVAPSLSGLSGGAERYDWGPALYFYLPLSEEGVPRQPFYVIDYWAEANGSTCPAG